MKVVWVIVKSCDGFLVVAVDAVGVDVSDLRVIIPVGGEAKRLKPLTAEVSKALVRFLNRPLVEHAMARLASQGVREFIFGVKGYINYKSLYDYFQDGAGFTAKYNLGHRVRIFYQPNVDDLGSADSIRLNMEYYDIDDYLLVVQGDNIFDVDLRDLLSFHIEKNALMTIALTRVVDVERYGIAEMDEDSKIFRFVEKPKSHETKSRLANTGIYILSPEIREVFSGEKVRRLMSERLRLDFGMDLIPMLVESGYAVYGYPLRGDWYDIGTPETYLDSMIKLINRTNAREYLGEPIDAPGKIWIQAHDQRENMGRERLVKKIRDGAIRVEGAALIGEHCQIGDNVVIRDSCIDNFSIILEGAVIERSAILDRTIIGESAQISDSIVSRHVKVSSSRDRPTRINEVSVIGDDVAIGEGCLITATKIYPHIVIPRNTRLENQIITT